MGIDLYKRGRIQSKTGRLATTTNVYHRLLIKLYKFLGRRTDSKFNKIIHKRLNQSRTTRYPISLSKLIKHADSAEKQGKVLVVVGNVLRISEPSLVMNGGQSARYLTSIAGEVSASFGRFANGIFLDRSLNRR